MNNIENKNILLINAGEKQFANDFIKHSKECNLATNVVNAKNCIFTIMDDNVNLLCNNVRIKPTDYAYAFIRLKGRDPHMTTLIARYLNFSGTPLNDKVNLSTTLIDSEKNMFNDEKITQMMIFALNDLSIPNTIIFSATSYKSNIEAINKLIKFPCVVKSTGAKGMSVWKIQNQSELEKIIDENKHELLILQDLLNIDYDIRTLIYNNEYLGAIKRTSTDGFYTNVSKGGKAESVNLSEEEIVLSKKACEVTGIDFGGVDFVRTADGIKFFEVNKSPQINGFQSATNINVPRRIVENIKNYIDSK